MRSSLISFSIFTLLLAACTPNFESEKIDFENDPRILRGEWIGDATLNSALIPLVYSPDGSRLFFNKAEVKSAIYDTEALAEIATLELPYGTDKAQFRPDNEMLVTATTMRYEEKNTISLWSARTGERLDSFPIEGEVVGFSQDLERYATKVPLPQRAGEEVVVWDMSTQERLTSLSLLDYSDSYYAAIKISADLSTVATCEDKLDEGDPTVKLRRVENGEEELSLALRFATYCTELLFSPDGSLLAVTDGASTRIWSVSAGAFLPDMNTVSPIAFSADNQRLITKEGYPPFVQFWDAQTGTKLGKVELEAGVFNTYAQVFSPQLDQVAWENPDGQLRILGLDSGDTLASITLSEPLDIELTLTATYVDKASYEVSGTLLYGGESYSIQSDISGGGNQEYIRPTTSPEEHVIRLDALDAGGEVRWTLEGPPPSYAYRDGEAQLNEVLFSGEIFRPDSEESLPRSFLLERRP